MILKFLVGISFVRKVWTKPLALRLPLSEYLSRDMKKSIKDGDVERSKPLISKKHKRKIIKLKTKDRHNLFQVSLIYTSKII